MIACKFVCQSVKKFRHWNRNPEPGKEFLYEAEFMAVTGDRPENKAFFEATPSGSLKIGTYKDDVFQPGKEYLIQMEISEP